MGVNCRVYYLVFAIDDEVDFALMYSSQYFHLHRVRPMVVAPEAMVGYL
jgi:hypothetical protein